MNLDGQVYQERRVFRLEVSGGAPRVRDSLSWRLATGIPQCDLVASDAAGAYTLLISDDGDDMAEVVRTRIDRMVERLNEFHPCDVPLRIDVMADEGPVTSAQRASA